MIQFYRVQHVLFPPDQRQRAFDLARICEDRVWTSFSGCDDEIPLTPIRDSSSVVDVETIVDGLQLRLKPRRAR